MRIFLSISAILAIVFVLYPELDVKFSHLFYSQESGFYLKNNGVVKFIYHLVPTLIKITVAGLVMLAIAINIKKTTILGWGNREVIYLLLVLAIGPGLIVHPLLKDHWGRARPSQTIEFGGTKQFSPPILISDQCEKNCSFASGHSAAGFYFITLAFLMRNWRKTMFSIGLSLGVMVSLVRIAQGGHYLSDTIFAGIITFLTAYYLYRLIFRDKGNLCQEFSKH